MRLAIAYKNFAANKGISHIGLGVAALNTAATLRAHGILTDVWPVNSADDIQARIKPETTHVVISAPWVASPAIQGLLTSYPDIQFAVVSHSNVGFLMADSNGIRLLREGLELQIGNHNFNVAGNSQKFCEAWAGMYGVAVKHLPNLYNISTSKQVGERQPWHGGTVRVGVFGATRPLKNMVTAVAAAIEVSSLVRQDVEIWMSSGRNEGGDAIGRAIYEMTARLPHVRIVQTGWQSWAGFRAVVSKMHVLLQPSYTESFNMVTADGLAEGVASVVSEAIDWVPHSWIANADSANEIAKTALHLLHDRHAVTAGQEALKRYVRHGVHSWKNHLAA